MKTFIIIAIILGLSFFIQQEVRQLPITDFEAKTEQLLKHKAQYAKDYTYTQSMSGHSDEAIEQAVPLLASMLKKLIVPIAGLTILMWVFLGFGIFYSFKEGA